MRYTPEPWPTTTTPSSQAIKGYINRELARIADAMPGKLVIDAADSAFNLPWNSDTDATPALEQLCKKVPPSSTVVLSQPGYLTLKQEWVPTALRGVTITTLKMPHSDQSGAMTRLRWAGSQSGGRMMFLRSCMECVLDGLYFDVGTADIAIDSDETGLLDQNGVKTTGTSCEFLNLKFEVTTRNPNLRLIRIADTNAPTSWQNQEHHLIRNIRAFGPGDTWMLTGQIAAGDNTMHLTSDLPSTQLAGEVIRIPNAANSGALRATCLNAPDKRTLILDRPADVSVVGERVLIREQVGVVVKIGPSPNAKKIRLERAQARGFGTFLWQENGSIQGTSNFVTNCETNYQIDKASDSIYLLGDSTEGSRTHLRYSADQPLHVIADRLDGQYTDPNGSFIDLRGAQMAKVDALRVGALVPKGSRIFDLRGAQVVDIHARFAGVTMHEAGLDDFTGTRLNVVQQGITDAPAPAFTIMGENGAHRGRYLSYGATGDGVADVVEMTASAGAGKEIGRQTILRSTGGGKEFVAHQIVVDLPPGMTFIPEEVVTPDGTVLYRRMVP